MISELSNSLLEFLTEYDSKSNYISQRVTIADTPLLFDFIFNPSSPGGNKRPANLVTISRALKVCLTYVTTKSSKIKNGKIYLFKVRKILACFMAKLPW